MNWFKSISLLGVLLVAAPALAQQRPVPPAPSPLRGYLIGGGAFLGNLEADKIAQIGERISRYATTFAVHEAFLHARLNQA